MTHPTRKDDDMEVTNGQIDGEHYGPLGDSARHIASFCEGDARQHVYLAAFNLLSAKDALIHQLGENAATAAREYADDVERLRTAALEWKARAKACEDALRKIDRMNDHPQWFRKSLNDILAALTVQP